MKLLAFLANRFQRFQNRVRVAVDDSGRGTDAKPFGKQLDDLNHLFMVNCQTVQRLRFRKCFVATNAAKPLNHAIFVAIRTGLLCFTVTAMARWHLTFRGLRFTVVLYLRGYH